MNGLLIVFAGGSALLWIAVFGYLIVLGGLAARRRPRRAGREVALPAVAVVVPTRNEAGRIDAKLADLRRSDYPADRLRVVVADGGSTDGTAERVAAACRAVPRLELVRVAGARGKAEQLNAVLDALPEGVVVVTDADAALAPDCIRRLVEALLADPEAAVVGAQVRPATPLLEERMHWWLVNRLWWLEGEALGAAGVSGVCYALRREGFRSLPADCTAEDIALALAAVGRGARVRLCRAALATELRVPRTLGELVRFRHRRGAGYLRELVRRPAAGARPRVHVVRALRLLHFLALPPLAAAVVGCGALLVAGGDWPWPLAAGLAFAAPAVAALAVSTTLAADRRAWWRLGLAAGRLAGLTWLSLLRAVGPELRPLAPGD